MKGIMFASEPKQPRNPDGSRRHVLEANHKSLRSSANKNDACNFPWYLTTNIDVGADAAAIK